MSLDAVVKPSYAVLAVIFGAITALFWFWALRRRDQPFLHCYAAIQVLFVYGLLVQQYSFDVAFETSLFAHALFFVFFVTLILTSVAGKRPPAQAVLASLSGISVRTLVAVAIAWLVFQVWLVARHGAIALAFARVSPDQLLELDLAFWEVILSGALRMLFLGALAIAVVRHATGERIGKHAALLLALITIAFISFGESPVGARRLILLLGVLWVAAAWTVQGAGFWRGARRHGVAVLAVVLAVGGLAAYYQAIRTNIEDSDIAADVLSGEPARIVAGMGRFLVPKGMDERTDFQFLRSGPLDFFIKVVDVRVNEGRGTGGEATTLSLSLVVPKVLYPGVKPVGNVDEVLLERLEIVPNRPFLYIDYSTSIAAIAMSDYGILGVVIGGVLVGLLFRLYWRALAAARGWPLVSIPLVGALVQLSASHEAGLTSLVANARDAALFAALIFVFSLAIRRLRTVVRLATASAHTNATVPSARTAQ